MTASHEFSGPLWQTRISMTETIPLHVYLVKGSEYAVFIDSGVKSMFSLLRETMQRAGVADSDLRFVLHTHSHHDHIGCNAQLRQTTGCLIAAPGHYAAWHSDFDRHYREFARPFPHLMPDTPELRAEVFDVLDEPHPLDLQVDEGVLFDLGGSVTLRAISLPGHMLAEVGWLESSTRTLILGDAITGLDWFQFHSHLTVQGYRDSLSKIRNLLAEEGVQQVVFAHFPPMTPEETKALTFRADGYINDIETTLIRILAAQPTATLKQLWQETCTRMERRLEFRALNMVHAHMQDLLARGLVQQVDTETYRLR